MSNLKAEVVVEFGDGEHLFKLSVVGILELEEKAGLPISEIVTRAAESRLGLKEAHNAIRLGLIGGGMDPAAALRLLRGYAYPERPLASDMTLARVVLTAAFVGFEQAPLDPGKAKAAKSRSGSPLPPSTAPLQ